MDNEKEISFGAFDSELMHQEISIPEGFEATIDGNKIILKKIESEDEKIRKSLIRNFTNQHSSNFPTADGFTREQILSWLEKQGQKPKKVSIWKHWKDGICGNGEGKLIYLIKNGDNYSLSSSLGYECDYIELSELDNLMIEKQGNQKSADKILEPKFKVGYWCIDNEDGTIFQIVKVLDNTYTYKTNEGKEYSCTHYSLENDARLWTIQDAKDGDILFAKGSYFKEYIFIYSGMTKDNVISTYCGFDMVHNNFDTKLSRFGRMEDFETVYPATKEQRDLLFQKMKEAGYTFDFKKKELKKLKFKVGDEVITKNEESLTITRIDEEGYWSEDLFICSFDDSDKWELVEPVEWSEEDMSKVQRICKYLNEAKKYYADITDVRECIDWLKFLEERYTWKPSDEQMRALDATAGIVGILTPTGVTLCSLYKDLKKLKGD